MTVAERQWYAVYTQARMEKWARSNLWERDFEVYLPQYSRQRRHARKTDWVSAPLFPRYLFVAADPDAPGRRSINSAPGVVSVVSFGERPAPLMPLLESMMMSVGSINFPTNNGASAKMADDG